MNLRKRYQAPLQRISEVSSPVGRSSQLIESKEDVDPSSMGQSYSSFLRIKQQKEQQQRRAHEQQLRQREEQIDKLKEEVIQLKMSITDLESKLEEYKYPTTCDCKVINDILEICTKWLKHPFLKRSRQFMLMAVLRYSISKNKKQFVYGRVMYWMLGIFEILNRGSDNQ